MVWKIKPFTIHLATDKPLPQFYSCRLYRSECGCVIHTIENAGTRLQKYYRTTKQFNTSPRGLPPHVNYLEGMIKWETSFRMLLKYQQLLVGECRKIPDHNDIENLSWLYFAFLNFLRF